MSTREARPRRASARTRAHTQQISSLRPGLSAPQVLTQPNYSVVGPSPTLTRRASQPARAQVQAEGPIPINLHPSEESIEREDILNCPLCQVVVNDDIQALCCDLCSTWYHANCLLITDDEYIQIGQSAEKWFCDHCRSVLANRIKWGYMEGEATIMCQVKLAYKEVT